MNIKDNAKLYIDSMKNFSVLNSISTQVTFLLMVINGLYELFKSNKLNYVSELFTKSEYKVDTSKWYLVCYGLNGFILLNPTQPFIDSASCNRLLNEFNIEHSRLFSEEPNAFKLTFRSVKGEDLLAKYTSRISSNVNTDVDFSTSRKMLSIGLAVLAVLGQIAGASKFESEKVERMYKESVYSLFGGQYYVVNYKYLGFIVLSQDYNSESDALEAMTLLSKQLSVELEAVNRIETYSEYTGKAGIGVLPDRDGADVVKSFMNDCRVIKANELKRLNSNRINIL